MVLAIAGACLATTANAATPTKKVRLYMNMGQVEIELYGNESPLNVANFLGYVNSGAYNDSMIHRTRDGASVATSSLFIQGGSFKTSGQQIATGAAVDNEFNAQNGLSNVPYTLAAARASDPDSATSGWFINKSNNAVGFDAGPYTVLGKVTHGFSIVDQIPHLNNLPILRGTYLETMPIYQNGEVIIHLAIEIPVLAGDYNFSGAVTADDYTVWRNNAGSQFNLKIDGNRNGVVDAADYLIWRNAMSAGAGTSAESTAVPEPSTAAMLILGSASSVLMKRRRPSMFAT